MSRLIEADYSQQFLLPPSLEDWVSAEHPARFIRDFVSQLDLTALGFKPQATSRDGRPTYSNALLLSIWIYGYMHKLRSTRKLEAALHEHVALMWLAGMHTPDHNTLWRFWRDNKKALKQVFRQSVRVAQQMGMVGMLVHALDGTKIQALSAKKNALHKRDLEALLAAVESAIEELEREVESEPHGQDVPGYLLPEALQDAQHRRDKIKQTLAQLAAENKNHDMPCEPDARLIQSHGKTQWSYNAQAVRDEEAGIIVAEEVTNAASDTQQLSPMLEEVKHNTGSCAETTLTDCGYRNTSQQAQAHKDGHNVLMPEHKGDSNPANPYDKSHFHYNQERDTYTCPQGKELPYSGVNRKKGITARIYRCRNHKICPVADQCTSNKYGRTLRRSPHEKFVNEQCQRRTTPEAQKLLAKRKGIIEPLFGHIKHNLHLRRWEMRGLPSVQAQWSMTCLAHNLTTIQKYLQTQKRKPKLQT